MQIDLAPNLSLLAIMGIFLLNYLVVRKFFLQPINSVLEEREHETKSAESLYEEALGRFRDATSEMEVQLQNAKREAAALRERFRGEAAARRQSLVEETSARAKETIAIADAKLQQDVVVARERITAESDALARLAAERILGRAV